MPEYVSYCPCCGKIAIRETPDEIIPFCKRCGSREPLINPNENETYEELCEEAKRAFGEDSGYTFSALLEQKYHITKNPLYNKEIADYVTKKESEESRAITNAVCQRAEEAAKPHCPTCGSTNIKKLDVVDRAVSVGFFGIFSNKINKSFKCKDCGCTW